jgi:hypothetical protein
MNSKRKEETMTAAVRELSLQESKDLLLGCAILGTGGGGSLRQGLAFVEEVLQEGKSIRLIALEGVPEDAWAASPYFCGALHPDEDEEGQPSHHKKEVKLCQRAFQELARHLGVEFAAVVPTELGGGNTAVALAVAAALGIPVVDGDPAGRAVPELQHSTFYLQGIAISPLAVATPQGDLVFVRSSEDEQAERLVRALAIASGGTVGVTDHPVQGGPLRRSLIPHTLSQALTIGRAVREARDQGADPVRAAAQAGRGVLLFVGRVQEAPWRLAEGFTVGELHLQGEGPFQDHCYRIWYKNEHMVAWLDEAVDVTAPDLICVLDAETGAPVLNPNVRPGQRVAVVGYPAPQAWRTGRGLAALGPKHFGYDLPYRPLEENPRLQMEGSTG